MFPQDLTYGYYSLGKTHGDPKFPIDIAMVEATEILEDGSIVPGASVGATPEILASAEKIIIEVNTALPSFKGLHDVGEIYAPPGRQPFLISHPSDRIGKTSIPIDPERVVAIVESDKPDNTGVNAPETEESRAIAGHLINFLADEVKAGRMPASLGPLQSGIGNVANSIIGVSAVLCRHADWPLTRSPRRRVSPTAPSSASTCGPRWAYFCTSETVL